MAAAVVLVCAACGEPKGSGGGARSADTASGEAPFGCRITLAHGSPIEQRSREQLIRLMKAYPLAPYIYTRELVIDENAIPHSHAVLTLHTRHVKDDDQLLSTFIHEELHWFAEQHKEELGAAVTELRAEFPGLPVGYPDGGQSEQSSYEHIVIIWGEYEDLAKLVGAQRADAVFTFWENDHYRALYRLLREHRPRIAEIVKKHGLVPDALR